MLQNVLRVLRKVAIKNILQFLSGNPSAKTYRLRAQFDHDTESRFAIQKENQIRSRPRAVCVQRGVPQCRVELDLWHTDRGMPA